MKGGIPSGNLIVVYKKTQKERTKTKRISINNDFLICSVVEKKIHAGIMGCYGEFLLGTATISTVGQEEQHPKVLLYVALKNLE